MSRTCKINSDIKPNQFGTMLHYAVMHNNTSIVKDLIGSGNVVDCFANNGKTPLVMALQHNHTEILRVLLEAGANINIANVDGQTALHVAAEANDLRMVTLLISNGANVNKLGRDRSTALHHAVEHKNVEMIEILLKNGADPNIPICPTGWTPLFQLYAKGYSDKEQFDNCVTILLRHGAVLDGPPNSTKTIFDYAFDLTESHPKSMDCLIAHLALLQSTGSRITDAMFYYKAVKDREMIAIVKDGIKLCQKLLEIRELQNLSVLDLLTDSEHKMRIHARNKNVLADVEGIYSTLTGLVPYYGIILKKRMFKAKRAVELEEEAVSLINDIFGTGGYHYLVARNIFSYVSDLDLENLVSVQSTLKNVI